uniref:Uncharacterized protein n=1 Tax=Spironucleus salmonicida TaxID=348837 RepID=V6LJF7_9EUKA|eukprot:EST42962.1 Hypothetical protein SS50377_17411 [Spironucleus salmonicida]
MEELWAEFRQPVRCGAILDPFKAIWPKRRTGENKVRQQFSGDSRAPIRAQSQANKVIVQIYSIIHSSASTMPAQMAQRRTGLEMMCDGTTGRVSGHDG